MLIALRAASLRLGSTVLLDQADLSIEPGERVCLVGRNGAGKSTLLRLLDGSLAPEEGRVVHDPGLKVARMVQDVPDDLAGPVFEIVARGLGSLGAVLARYHALIETAPERLDELGRLQTRLDAEDGWSLDARVAETLSRLELDGSARFEQLSGGLKRRVLLAQALVGAPDLLLLDEPTNHLDISSIQWLEGFLRSLNIAVVFVTHDRAFLRAVATRILELDRGWLTSWPGDYDNYLRRKAERAHAEAQENALFDKRLAQEEVWIRKGIEARRTRNQGRVERLKQMRREFAERRNALGKASMQIAEGERSGKRVVEVRDLHYAVGGRTLVRRFTATVQRGDKIGLIGPNGVGKTTLIRLLLGQLAPTSGEVIEGSNLQIAFFDQLRGGLDENRSVVDNLGEGKDTVEVGGQRKHVMGYLQDFLFTPDRARSPVRSLSGGERNRLLLARLFARPSNLLVLDEPTNDLDVETLELLEELLIDYSGTVLLVSHDRAFLDNVVSRSFVFEGEGRVGDYVGGYSDWLRQAPVARDRPAVPATAAGRPETPAGASAPRPAAGPGLSGKERKELDELPARIDALEAQLAGLAQRLSDPAVYADKTYAGRLRAEAEAAQQALDLALSRWELLEARR
ncbi:MAG TPA: ATP-binding cassette domain-containing protein [Nevskiaceae bacterium]|nr:ATP-binding cassette domain-containing protein [Nevskiaceae bacterium]